MQLDGKVPKPSFLFNIPTLLMKESNILNKKEGFWENVCLSPYSDKKNKYRL